MRQTGIKSAGHSTLANTEFFGEALLGQALTRRALARQYPALNFFPDMPAKWRRL